MERKECNDDSPRATQFSRVRDRERERRMEERVRERERGRGAGGELLIREQPVVTHLE